MLAAGANPVVQCGAALGNTVIYPSGKSLVLWTSEGNRVVGVCEARVTCVAALADGSGVVAGTQDGSVYSYKTELELVDKLPKSVTCVCALNAGEFAAGCSDGSVYMFPNKRSLAVKSGVFPLCLAFMDGILAIGGTSGSVFVVVDDNVTELAGHENWVRSLAFRKDSAGLLLASGSQDKYIRLWRVSRTTKDTTTTLTSKKYYAGPWTIELEALLMGHDDWVISIAWNLVSGELLSASGDSSLIIWSPDESDESDEGIWMPRQRLGDVSIMGASTATGATGGFWTAIWLDSFKLVATVSRSGSWRLWDATSMAPLAGPTGHTKSVTDVAWMPNGSLLSTSLDQTTRLWLPKLGLKEVGRPQIHGYDMITVAALDNTSFVSAGDEKTVRVFTMPQPVADELAELGVEGTLDSGHALPAAAGVPALGLSNKTALQDEDATNDSSVSREDQLQRRTLWPETEKLFGHGFEITSVAASSKYIATCCKALNEKHAVIRVYDRSNYRHVATLGNHQLTITRLRFSPSGNRLLSVGRDRKWALYDMDQLTQVLDKPKAHTRIVWDCAFVDEDTFVTASRDKTLKRWSVDGTLLGSVPFEVAVTACDATPDKVVVGLDNGKVFVGEEPQLVYTAPGRINRVLLHDEHIAVASDGALIVL